MVSEDDIVKYALGLGDVTERSDGELRLFERGEKIFLIVEKKTSPLRIETRIEIICSGQLTDEEILDLIRHSFEISMPDGE